MQADVESQQSRLADPERFMRALYRAVLLREADPDGLAGYAAALRGGMDPAEVIELFLASQEFRDRQAPVLFVPPGHYYSPIPDPADAGQHLARLEARGFPEALPGIALDRAAMVALWKRLVPLMEDAPFPEEETPGFRYWRANSGYDWGDACVLHAMLRLLRPKRLIEIGCGWSSACTLDTIDRYLNGACETTFIDPYPDRLRRVLRAEETGAVILEQRVQDVPPEIFDVLEAGDVLFIDSTHVLKTGSDVCFELFEILPRLKPGVVVHVHDMFWPFEYPRSWAVEESRAWNEAYALRAYLTDNPHWEFLVFNDYLAKVEQPLMAATHPWFGRNTGCALWLRRR